jgi:subtilisin family serine protease
LMVYGPFSLADALDARLDLQAWVRTELSFDYFHILASPDGLSTLGGYSLSGDFVTLAGGNGWMNIALDLKRVPGLGDLTGESQVWVALVFQSDESITYEGVYVDNVVIEKITGGYQGLTSDVWEYLQWGLNNNGQSWGTPGADISAPEAWGVSHGSDAITVAIIDDGVDLSHPDLAAKLVPGYDATGNGSGGGPSGDEAHGTNCAGIAAALTNNGKGVAGVAWEAKIMPVRIFIGDSTTDSWAANGINWATNNGADVLSNSWGGGSSSTAITNAINNAKANGRGGKGAVVVFASGNDDGPVIYPANLSNVLAVGALSPCDERKSWTSCDGEPGWGSNYGPELDIMAPGVHMYSTDIQGAAGDDPGNYNYKFNGTSSATPVVAGVASLLLGAEPNLTAAQVENRLKTTADDLGAAGWDSQTGYGRVNVYEALLASPSTYLLTVTKSGSGSGTVTSDPAGINCGGDCSESYVDETVVQLTATQAVGSTFAGWSGHSDCSDGWVTMDAAKTCTATFNSLPTYNLSVSKTGAGSGTVKSNPQGINCGSDCSEAFYAGTQVALYALPASGSQVVGWSGHSDCGDGWVTMNTSLSCTAELGMCPAGLSEVVVSAQTVAGTETFEACNTLLAGAGGGFVVASSGDVTFAAGNEVILQDGFAVASGGRFRAVIGQPMSSSVEMLYDQTATPSGGGISSQQFESANSSYNAMAADDFVIPATDSQWQVSRVVAEGFYANGTEGPAPYVNVKLFSNSSGVPGSPMCTYTGLAAGSGFSDSDGALTINLPTSCGLSPGKYWLMVQADMDYNPNGSWYWGTRNVSSNGQYVWQNPGNGYGTGCTTWTSAGSCELLDQGVLFSLQGTKN